MLEGRPMAVLLEPTELSVRQAERFGTVKYLFYSHKDLPTVSSRLFAPTVLERLSELGFEADKDFVVLTGKMLPMTALIALMVAEYGSVRALYFNGHDTKRDYEEVRLGGAAVNVVR